MTSFDVRVLRTSQLYVYQPWSCCTDWNYGRIYHMDFCPGSSPYRNTKSQFSFGFVPCTNMVMQIMQWRHGHCQVISILFSKSYSLWYCILTGLTNSMKNVLYQNMYNKQCKLYKDLASYIEDPALKNRLGILLLVDM